MRDEWRGEVDGRLACGSKGWGGVSLLVTRQRELLARG